MEREAKADEYLKNRRIEVYTELWKHTKTWARSYRGEEQKDKDAKMLFDYLHEWYFDVGGMFLSEMNRDRLLSSQGIIG